MKKGKKLIFTILLFLVALLLFFIFFYERFSNEENRLLQAFYLCISSISFLGSCYCLSKIKEDKARSIMKLGVLYSIFLYLILITDMLFITPYYQQISFDRQIEWIPFKSVFPLLQALFEKSNILSFYFKNVIGNFVIFMPFAFFFPMLCKKMNEKLPFFISMCLLGIEMELLQSLMKVGIFSIDNIVLRVLGAFLVFSIIMYPPIKNRIRSFLYLNTKEELEWQKK